MAMAAHFIVECLDCGYTTPYFPTSVTCPRCGCGWREALYDYQSLAKALPLQLPGRPFDLWRYHELLPVRDHNPDLFLGEGGTPLIRASSFGNRIQCPNLYIKDERQNPTGSFKDRQAAITIAALHESNIDEIVVASSGNNALAYAAFAARSGIRVWAFLPARATAIKIKEIALYGARVIKTSGNYEATRQIAMEFARQRNIFFDQGPQTVPAIEAMKTIAFEVSEQLTASMGPRVSPDRNEAFSPWRAPDWYIQAVSLGVGPLGVLKGFTELKLMGITGQIPALGLIQPEGCSPMVQAWQTGQEIADPCEHPHTDIETLTAMDPGRAYTMLNHRMTRGPSGIFESVQDRETYQAVSLLARTEGISAEPAAGVAFAGLIKLCNRGIIKEKDVVVVNCTGHTASMDRINRWSTLERNRFTSSLLYSSDENIIASLHLIDFSENPRLFVAVENEITNRIIQLYCKLLGAGEVFSATSVSGTLSSIRTNAPDLLILDLASTRLNGYAILDELFSKESALTIPTIGLLSGTLSAKETAQMQSTLELLNPRHEQNTSADLAELISLLN